MEQKFYTIHDMANLASDPDFPLEVATLTDGCHRCLVKGFSSRESNAACCLTLHFLL